MRTEVPLRVIVAAPRARDRARIKRLACMYTERSYEFSEVANGAETLRALSDPETGCVLLTDPLPDMDAPQLLRRIHTEFAPVPAIVIADRIDEERASRTLAAGAASYLSKQQLTAQVIADALEVALSTATPAGFALEQRRKRPEHPTLDDEHAAGECPSPAIEARESAAALPSADPGDAEGFALSWSLSGRFRHARGHQLTMLGVRVEGASSAPPEGATLDLSLDLLSGVPPLRVRGHVIRALEGGRFDVAFIGLRRRDKVLLRNAARVGSAGRLEPTPVKASPKKNEPS